MDWRAGKFAIANAIHLDLTHQQEHYARALGRHLRPGDKWLDVGCGHTIVPDWAMPIDEQKRLVASAAMMVGVDVDESIALHPLLPNRVEATGEAQPFRDESFDLVTANLVVEHVVNPQRFLAEIHRVLRPGGHFLFVTPNLLSPLMFAAHIMPGNLVKRTAEFLESRHEEDIFPAHYRMNTAVAIGRLASETGFEVEELSLVGTVGVLDRLGPVAWAECLLLKGLASSFHGKLQPDILAVLKRGVARPNGQASGTA